MANELAQSRTRIHQGGNTGNLEQGVASPRVPTPDPLRFRTGEREWAGHLRPNRILKRDS